MVGGGAVSVHYLAQSLSEAGHEVAVLAPGERVDGMSYRVDPLSRSGPDVPYEEVLYNNLDAQKKRFDFDVLHAHFAWPAGYAAARWGHENGIPTVITCHGIDLNTDRRIGYGYRLRTELADKIKTALEEARAVVCVCRFLAGKAIGAGCPEYKLRVIPNGVALDEFSQTGPGPETEPYILFLGNLRHVKGVDLLLSAFGRIVRESGDIKLYLAGDGNEKASLVEAVLNEPALSGRVLFLKPVSGKEKAGLFANCLFFVCPSRVEAFPIVNLEAIASSKPVVAFDVGGVGEAVTDGENGFLIKPYDLDAFSYAMKKLAADRGLRIKMGQAARIRARDFDWQLIAARYIDLYSSL